MAGHHLGEPGHPPQLQIGDPPGGSLEHKAFIGIFDIFESPAMLLSN